MLSETATVLSTLHAVQAFMTTHAQALGNLNTSASRQDLDSIESTLSTQALAQVSSRNSGTSTRTRLRVAKNTLLVKYLRPMSAIAEAKLSQSPDFAELKLPKSTRSTQQLVTAAGAMGDAASKQADTFIAAGMAPTFLADLKSAVHDVIAAEASKSNTKSSRMGATSALEVNTSQARKVVKQLNALIEPQLANDPALLVKWKATKRFTSSGTAVSVAATDAAQSTAAQSEPAGTAPTVTPVAPAAPVTSTAPHTGVPSAAAGGSATTA
jgi:hypothetical protein